jgi:hypothetical protein
MARKILSTALLLIGVLGAIILLTYGGQVFPHIFGPSAAVIVGAALLLFKK